jgi:tRNA pseudouridine32 synthase/23S rRNA pseudouridine746 synthase
MQADPQPMASGIPVVCVDDTFVVVNKPSGMLSVPGRGPEKQDCLSSRVQTLFVDALVVHRLDMATSGLLVMARGPLAQRRLNDAFAQREVHKRYLAWVKGRLETPGNDWRNIDLPIIVDWSNRPLRVIDHQRGQASVTRLRTVQIDPTGNSTLVELEPITGRSHQLRVHLQAIGHPILGDALYAPGAVAAMAPRLQLHASNLAFPHPVTGAMVRFDCNADF